MKSHNSNRVSNHLKNLSKVLAVSVLTGLLALAPQMRPVTAAAAGLGAPAPASFVVPVDPRATFLHTMMKDDVNASDDPATPTVIDLAQAGLMPGMDVKLSYQVLQPFNYICGDQSLQGELPVMIAVFARSNNLFAPAEMHRIPEAVKAGDEIRTGPCGHSLQSEPDDIDEDFQILPTTGTVVRIPEGATHLFIGVVDSFYKDNCGQLTVTVETAGGFDICLQDDTTGDMLFINSFTGDYRFVRCGAEGFVRNDTGGRRSISRKGCTITLNDALVSAVIDTCGSRGSATIKNPNLVGPNYSLSDSDTRNNTAVCPGR